ncbi:MAG: site-specific integrase [Phycisphaerae bacterium]|jgi:integrase
MSVKKASISASPPTGKFSKSDRVPKLRRHKPTGQGYVVLSGRTFYLGRHNSPEALQKYHRVLAEWMANGRQLRIDPQQITVKEMLARFWLYAENHYRRSNGAASSELGNYLTVIKFLKKLYADTRACDFGPMALRVVREQMVAQGWCRSSVNRMAGRIKSIFRWATEQELIPGSIWHALMAVAGLRSGYCEAPEPAPVRPVRQELVDAVKPFVSRQIWAMIQLQLLTAARPGELCVLRPCDIDRSGKVWMYKPPHHKTSHHGHERVVYIGPRAQAMLMPFLLRPAESYCFSPAEALHEHYQQRHQLRKTPLHYGNRPGANRVERPQRTPGDQYDVNAYRRAIERACELASPLPEHLRSQRLEETRKRETPQQWRSHLSDAQKAEVRAWRKAHHWHPHQLRHNAATGLRKEFGLETARIILGHRSAAVTLIYAEADMQKAIEVIEKVG